MKAESPATIRTTSDRAATQWTGVFGILVTHCAQTLTPERVEQIANELVREIQEGGTAWAFGTNASVLAALCEFVDERSSHKLTDRERLQKARDAIALAEGRAS